MKNARRKPKAFSLLFSVCFLSLYPGPVKAERITIGGSAVISVLPYIAKEEGYFKSHGLDVEIVRIQIGKLAMDAVLSNSVDFGVVVDTNLAFNSFKDSDLRAVASILEFSTNGLAYRRDAGIKGAVQLRGKRVAYLPATTSHIYLVKLLRANRMQMTDIKPVILQAPAMLPSMRLGTVDAVSIWDPWRYQIRRELASAVGEIKNNKGIYRPRAFLAARLSTLQERPDVSKRLLRALIEAEQFVLNNLDEVKRRYAAWNSMDVGSIDAVWPQFRFRVELSHSAYEVIRDDVEIIASTVRGFDTKSSRGLDDILHTGPLTNIEPARVGLPDER